MQVEHIGWQHGQAHGDFGEKLAGQGRCRSVSESSRQSEDSSCPKLVGGNLVSGDAHSLRRLGSSHRCAECLWLQQTELDGYAYGLAIVQIEHVHVLADGIVGLEGCG